MLTLYENTPSLEKVILCGIRIDETEEEFASYLRECERICEANLMEVVGCITQNLKSIDNKTAFGKGKIQELEFYTQNLCVNTLVFVNDLSFSTLKSLETLYPDWQIIDKTTLILNIFSKRATSRQAKIQTEMARLKYHLPKEFRSQTNSEDRNRSGGGHQSRGAGESRTSITKRKLEKELHALRKELKSLEEQAEVQRKQRNRSNLKKVALVGYTNAGKSSLLNILLTLDKRKNQQVLAKDMLFATLDTSVRKIKHNNCTFLLFDTVGFVSKLPHTLIEAFNTTLQAVLEADLLIHVIDLSHPEAKMQAEVTLKTLKEIGAGNIPIINVLNKVDLYPDLRKNMEIWGNDSLLISTKTQEGIIELKDEIIKRLTQTTSIFNLMIPYTDYTKLYSTLKQFFIIEEEAQEEGMSLKISMEKEYIHLFEKYLRVKI